MVTTPSLMPSPTPAVTNPIFLANILVFGATAVACFGSVLRARRIEDEDTRRGLVALLLTSGGWAAAHVGFLVAPTVELKLVFYQIGLFVGLSTVGPWLYFCSAYTGRTLHRSSSIRRVAVGVFLAISFVKFTNPIHQLYFRAEVMQTPFPHLAIQAQPLHWLAMGLAYALAIVGYFMLFELFWQVGHDTTPLVVLVVVTGLPIVLDVLGEILPQLLSFAYEPLGVAAFALGILFVYLEDFQTVQLAGVSDSPTIVLTDANHVRDYNEQAKEMFPPLETGKTIDAVLPRLAEYLDQKQTEAVVEIERAGGLRYFQLAIQPFGGSQTMSGQFVTLTDVTDREQHRRELERQNERLDQFASMVSHDLRNPLNVAQGRVDLAMKETESEHLAAAARALDRIGALIDDVLALARQGQPIDELERVRLGAVVEEGWSVVDTAGATLDVADDGELSADASRLQQLFENLFRNAVEHGGEDVTVRVGLLDDRAGFFVADDGPGVPAETRDEVFELGHTTNADGTGFGLGIVKEIATAHGWDIDVTESEAGGARFEVTGVEFLE
ncbi:MAG: ATP-binding protein [Halolamina sp.]